MSLLAIRRLIKNAQTFGFRRQLSNAVADSSLLGKHPESVKCQFDQHRIRNIGIIAHIDAGKTTTTERMLYFAGVTKHIGDVDDGDTVMDYLKQEQERGITIQSAAITFPWRNQRINLIDTPGHADFTFEVERAVRILDGAVMILDAVHGVEAQTETVWSQASRYQVPRLAFVNKLDRPGANFEQTLKSIIHRLPHVGTVLPLQVPVDISPDRVAIADLVEGNVLSWDRLSENQRTLAPSDDFVSKPISLLKDPDSKACIERYREFLLDALSDIDNEFLEIMLLDSENGKSPSPENIKQAIRRVTIEGKALPVLCGSAIRNVGVGPLLDAIVNYLPTPADRLPATNGEDVSAFAFKVLADKRRGPVVFVRVYSGTITNKSNLLNLVSGQREKVGKIFQLHADDLEEISHVSAGNIAAIIGLKQTRTGDTLTLVDHKHHQHHAPGKHPLLPSISIPPPVFSCSVEPESVSQEKHLIECLKILQLEDPSFSYQSNEETGQLVISGMGELHLEILKDRLIKEFDVRCRMGEIWIAYRETLKDNFQGFTMTSFELERDKFHRYQPLKMQMEIAGIKGDISAAFTGGNNIRIDLSPTLSTKLLSHHELVSTMKSAVETALMRGPLLGMPLMGLNVHIKNVKLPAPDVITASGLRQQTFDVVYGLLNKHRRELELASKEAAPLVDNSISELLEPLMRVSITVPDRYYGLVLGDLTGSRSAEILDTGDEQFSLSEEDKDNENSTNRKLMEMLLPKNRPFSSPSNPGNDATQIHKRKIEGIAPLSLLLGYSPTLRALTQGHGSLTLQIHGYGKVTRDRAVKVVKTIRGF